MQPISKVLITPIGMACNLNCTYCYNLPFGGHGVFRKSPPISLLGKLYQGLLEFGGKSITFIWHGGEPTIAGLSYYERVMQMQSGILASGRRVQNCMQTNATRITSAWGAFFRRYEIRPSISVDGPAWMHDTNRRYPSGRGSYDAVMRGVEVLHSNDVKFGLLIVVTKRTVGHAGRLFEWIVRNHL